MEKLLRSAIANWEQKNERKAESGELFVTKRFLLMQKKLSVQQSIAYMKWEEMESAGYRKNLF